MISSMIILQWSWWKLNTEEIMCITSILELPTGGVGHGHVHHQNYCIFAKIFHISLLATVQNPMLEIGGD